MDKMEEMALVMQQAVRMDDEVANKMQEHIARLEIENRTLRQLLEICTTANHPILSHSHHDLDANSSLDNSCCSQQSQIEVRPAAAEGSPGAQDKSGGQESPGSQDTFRDQDKSVVESEPGAQDNKPGGQDNNPGGDSNSPGDQDNSPGGPDKSKGPDKAGGENNIGSRGNKDNPGDGEKSWTHSTLGSLFW